jgi:branched-chain amino acid transport system substrate-binding protein
VTRVYVSLPLRGPSGHPGRDVLRGAELAFERRAPAGVELVVRDTSGPDRDDRAIAVAEEAAADPRALALVGDFHSSQVRATVGILGPVGLLHIAPVATQMGLRSPTLVRLTPDDEAGARAIASWVGIAGVGELLVVHDHDDDYGLPVAAACVRAARQLGLEVRSRPVWDWNERPADDLGAAGAVLYVGVAGSGAANLWRDLHAANPRLWLLGTDGVASPRLAGEISAQAAERTRFFVAARAPFALYGVEAMELALDAIATGGGDRAAVVAAARGTRDRDSLLGRYSVDDEGAVVGPPYGRLRVAGGELDWDRV